MLPFYSGSRKDVINTFLLTAGYGMFLMLLMVFLHKAAMAQDMPDSVSLRRWDAGIYDDIRIHGYTYNAPKYNNTGCFIFFPWLWRMLGVSVAKISCINYIFFTIGFTILAQLYKFTTQQKMLYLSFPTVYMMMIPYTEALFFLLVMLAFLGIVKKIRWLIWLSLFIAALTRPTALFLLPAFMVMELICDTAGRKWHTVIGYYFLDYVLPVISGLALFIWYQHHVVGLWFAYFIQQQKYNGHIFGIPILPFSSMEGRRMLWICALAMCCCVLSVIVIIIKIAGWGIKGVKAPDKLLVVSLMFLSITLYKTVFYNPTWVTNTTLTVGLNRYVFATPFFYIFLHYFTSRQVAYRAVHFLLALLLCNAVWLLCGSYDHIRSFLFFNFLTMLVMLYMLLPDRRLTWPPLAIMAINAIFQVIMFQQYLANLYLE